MKERSEFNMQRILSGLFFAVTFLLRALLAVRIGIWFPAAQRWDDRLMIVYADFQTHFTEPDPDSLVKYIGYPLFLNLVKLSHIPYTVWVAILWWCGAVLGFLLMKQICRVKIMPYATYLYLLFMPQAFEIWGGTRLYRNALIGPMALIVLLLMLLILFRVGKEQKGIDYWLPVFLGLLFLQTYYLKEDGLWLLACLILWAFVGVAVIVRKRMWKKVVFFCIPFVLFGVGTLTYGMVNRHYFDVFEINTRTEGEFGRFCKQIYRIDSERRTAEVWAPYDALEKAFEASETLMEYPELLASIHNSPRFQGNIEEYPIQGDFLGWVLRDSLVDCEMWGTERQVEELFHQINEELEEAFRDGRLPKQKGRIQLLASAGGRTFSEITELHTLVAEGMKGAIWLKGYEAGIGGVSEQEWVENVAYIAMAREYTNLPDLDGSDRQDRPYLGAKNVVNVLFWCYRIGNTGLFVVLCGSIFAGIVQGIRKARDLRQFVMAHIGCYSKLLTAAVFLGIGVLYAFSIGWFSSFLFQEEIVMRTLNFYDIALPVILAVAYLFAVAGVSDLRS